MKKTQKFGDQARQEVFVFMPNTQCKRGKINKSSLIKVKNFSLLRREK
jgi:hypothetical protein